MNPIIIPYGDHALIVHFDNKIEVANNKKVHDLKSKIDASKIKGITFIVPAYCSLTLGYDPSIVNFQKLNECIITLLDDNDQVENTGANVKEIPVCYHDQFGIDLKNLEQTLQLDKQEIISIHTEKEYYVYMLGFLPGFPYMGKLDQKLKTKRRDNPRLRVPERSVAIASNQTGIYPSSAPGGWNIIGRTPLPLFWENEKPKFLFSPGDRIRFRSITTQEYHEMIFQNNVKDV